MSIAKVDALVMWERERIGEKLQRQRRKLGGRREGDDNDKDDNLFELGMWIEALKKNRRPYLIAQIVGASLEKGGGMAYNLRYEDRYLERNVQPWGGGI
jgi:hypothetical protein